MALKQLDEIIELSETYAYWHKDYKTKLTALLTEINDKFKSHPDLKGVQVKALDTGELRIEPNRLYINLHGQMNHEFITISANDILAIAEILKSEVL